MFVDFNRTFKGKPLSETKVPDIVVKKLSEKLPAGVKYIAAEEGTVQMISESGEITLGGFTANVPDKFKPVLGDHYTKDDVLQLSYNAQEPIPMELTHEGYITVNGKEIPFNQIHYNIFHETKLVDNKIMAYPQKFPKPFELVMGTENGRYTRKLMMSRKPLLSLKEICFQSEEEQPFQMEFHSSLTDVKAGTVTIKMRLQYAKTIRDMVESIFVYNDLVDGKAKMNGLPFEFDDSKVSMEKFNLNGACFWEKVLKVEEFLQFHFAPPDGNTNYQDICDIETLYRNLICNTAIRQGQRLEEITGTFKLEGDVLERAKAGKIYFQYQMTYTFDLFGIKFQLPVICGLFNAAVKEIEPIKNGKTKIKFKDKNPDNPAYTSIICFKDEILLNEFLSKNGDNISAFLENAKLASDYLK